MKRICTILAAAAMCAAATACGPSLNAQPVSDSETESQIKLDMPDIDVSVPDVNVSVPDIEITVEQPDISIPDMSVPDPAEYFGDSTADAAPAQSASGQNDRITDESGDFVYEGKLQQIGDDENGYIQVPLGYLRFQDEDVDGLTQYCDTSGKNIVTLDHYVGTDYYTAAQNLHAYMESQSDLEGLTGATVHPAGYNAYQIYGHYTDGFFIVAWLIEDPAHPEDTYYLAIEFDNDHSYLMACSSTFQTVEDHQKANGS
ncbi:MAG: hypothetical protein II916_08920 [Oscillospiraceae bacterium]|nr:hypothetical protein [Oscillospiraceae bacterium]